MSMVVKIRKAKRSEEPALFDVDVPQIIACTTLDAHLLVDIEYSPRYHRTGSYNRNGEGGR